MKNCMNRGLALLLALSMSISVFSLQTYAADETIIETETTSEAGLTTNTTTTTTTTTDEDGKTTIVVTIDKTTNGTTDNDVNVKGNEKYCEEIVKDDEGNTLSESWSKEGTEIKSSEGTEIDASLLPDVEIELIPGETTSSKESESTTTTSGDVKDGENDEAYDYTTTIIDREVTATTNKSEITVNNSKSEMTAVNPEKYEGKVNISVGVFTNPDTVTAGKAPEGYEYQYLGTGDYSTLYVSKVYVNYKRDQENNIIYDEDGNPVIDYLSKSNGTIITDAITGEPATDINGFFEQTTGVRAKQFMLKDTKDNVVYGYCVDLGTPTVNKTWYTVSNLEDSNYYPTEDAEKHVRAIVTNGYWGTNNEKDENGNYNTGSLAGIVDNMKSALKDGTIDDEMTISYYDEVSKTIKTETVKLSDIIEDLTEGEALSATQAAIWSYSNGSQDVLKGVEDGDAVVSSVIYGALGYGSAYDVQSGARLQAVYNWLINLEPEEKTTVIINEKNFVDMIGLTVGEKVDEKESTDADGNAVVNGIYETALNFTLAFVPTENDDLLIHVMYTDLEGNPVTVVRRLGEKKQGDIYDVITPDKDGNYTLTGLKLSENEEFNFDLRLEGTQYLDQGVYIYTAQGGRDASQFFVGMAEGTHEIDITNSVTVSFDVNEKAEVSVEHSWKDSDSETYEVETEEESGDENFNQKETESVPGNENWTPNDPGDGTVEIEDEDVPLADAPETGDMAMMLLAAAAVSGAGFLAAARKKKED